MATRIMVGNAMERLLELPDESVQCCITSPPYWGLRAYTGGLGMIGMEATFEEHLATLVSVFREVRRVLRKEGTLWLNYGDAYYGGGRGEHDRGATKQGTSLGSSVPKGRPVRGLKPKDLMFMPARVAMALQADGWWVRSEIIWVKPNPMPESVTDRPTGAHEKLFLLSKSPRYFYDEVAVKTPKMLSSLIRDKNPTPRGNRQQEGATPPNRPPDWGLNNQSDSLANLRNVWIITPKGFKEAHFATFPPELVEPCIKAGTSHNGCCVKCGSPRARITRSHLVPRPGAEKTSVVNDRDLGADKNSQGHNRQKDGHKPGYVRKYTMGWRASCACYADTKPCVVLDPFGGAGTTGMVATRLNRDSILVEISPEYAEMSRRRILNDRPFFADVTIR